MRSAKRSWTSRICWRRSSRFTLAAIALIANEVQLMIISYASLRGQIQGNLVRPVAVAAAQRLPALPEVPTIAESGYPKIDRSEEHTV